MRAGDHRVYCFPGAIERVHHDRSLGELTGGYVLDITGTRIGSIARHAMAAKVPGQFDRLADGRPLDGAAQRLGS
ncbi:hypothetical protein [Actinomadura terrae]|uniref:hypothetical protein n=1 Tax=Actinomadura terrae TaxID=604353 RepID=UPI001FA6D449|nr:hypothetical protein [Actinomadura terrae]